MAVRFELAGPPGAFLRPGRRQPAGARFHADRLKRFLADAAIDPDRLTALLADFQSEADAANLGDSDRAALLSGDPDVLYDHLIGRREANRTPASLTTRAGGSLVIVGTGIRMVGQLTMEAIAHIRRADRVFHLVDDPIAEPALARLNPAGSVTLADLYAEGKPRIDTYREMVVRILEPVRAGLDVCAAFYGNPAILVWAAQEAVAAARREGLPAWILPSVSAEDCLFADLGINPGQAGCQSYKTSRFLIGRRRPVCRS